MSDDPQSLAELRRRSRRFTELAFAFMALAAVAAALALQHLALPAALGLDDEARRVIASSFAGLAALDALLLLVWERVSTAVAGRG